MKLWFVRTRTIVLLSGLAGCEPEGSATLSSRIEQPELGVEGTLLTTELTGGFALVLSLGDYAPDPTTVELGAFTLQRDGVVLTSGFELATTPAFPLEVGVGQSKRVEVAVMDSLGEPELAMTLCEGELSFAGTLKDSLNSPSNATSSAFAPSCL